MGEVPLMTSTGSFSLMESERVVVSQLHRSQEFLIMIKERHIHLEKYSIQQDYSLQRFMVRF